MDEIVKKLLAIQSHLGMEPSYRGNFADCGAYGAHQLLDDIEAHLYAHNGKTSNKLSPEALAAKKAELDSAAAAAEQFQNDDDSSDCGSDLSCQFVKQRKHDEKMTKDRRGS